MVFPARHGAAACRRRDRAVRPRWVYRAGVERVKASCTPAETDAFLAHVPQLEKLRVDDGLLLVKYWPTTARANQEERFPERLVGTIKRWKLASIDLKAREKHAEYCAARDAMLAATHP